MKLHALAALSLKQRQEVKRLHQEEKISIRILAQRFRVNPSTIQRWINRESPLDKTSAPLHHPTVITPAYRAAVMEYRKAYPQAGPVTIAQSLQDEYSQANRGTVLRILQEEQLTRPPQKQRSSTQPIPVGRHRIQMDIQQLPAVEGGKGFEYMISMIHLRTRYKYSEIHQDMSSKTVSQVLRRGLDHLPPFSSSGQTMPLSSP